MGPFIYFASFGAFTLQVLWNKSTLHHGRAQIQRILLWSLQAPCLVLVISHLQLKFAFVSFLRICQQKFTWTSDITPRSVTFDQCNWNVSTVHQGLTKTLKAMRHSYFRRSNEKSGGNRMFMVTANRCPPRVWLHLLEIKMLWHKCSFKWTGVQRWWYTWQSADKRYQGTARTDRGHEKDTPNSEYSCETGDQVAD